MCGCVVCCILWAIFIWVLDELAFFFFYSLVNERSQISGSWGGGHTEVTDLSSQARDSLAINVMGVQYGRVYKRFRPVRLTRGLSEVPECTRVLVCVPDEQPTAHPRGPLDS